MPVGAFPPNDTYSKEEANSRFGSGISQSAEGVVVEPWAITFATSGAPKFQVQAQSFANTGAQAGTYNHGVWYGFNAGRHGSGSVTAGKPAIIMGFEDNYYDDGGDGFRGVEWYVEYWSPDGTTQQMLRPFYTRIQGDANTITGAAIISNIGKAAGNGQFTVRTGNTGTGDTTLFNINATSITLALPVIATAPGVFTLQPTSGNGRLYINSPTATVPGFQVDINSVNAFQMVAQNVGRLQILTGTGGLHIDMTGVSGGGANNTTYLRSGLRAEGGFAVFNSALITTKPTVTGSKGANAALTSLLTALASYGLITDSSS